MYVFYDQLQREIQTCERRKIAIIEIITLLGLSLDNLIIEPLPIKVRRFSTSAITNNNSNLNTIGWTKSQSLSYSSKRTMYIGFIFILLDHSNLP